MEKLTTDSSDREVLALVMHLFYHWWLMDT
jgi:hypothetical protein